MLIFGIVVNPAIIILGALCIIYGAYSFIRTSKVVIISCDARAKNIPLFVLAGIFTVIYYTVYGIGPAQHISVGLVIIVTLMYAVIRSGLGETSLSSNGRVIPYSKFETFAVDDINDKFFRLRITGMSREVILPMPNERKNEAVARVIAAGLKPAEESKRKSR